MQDEAKAVAPSALGAPGATGSPYLPVQGTQHPQHPQPAPGQGGHAAGTPRPREGRLTPAFPTGSGTDPALISSRGKFLW